MKQAERRRTIAYFAAIQFLYYIATGLWNYVNVYFRELGFNGQQVGFMSVGGTCLTMVLLPVMGVLGDKIRSPKTVFAWAIRLTVPLFLLVPVFGHLWGASVVPFFLLSAVLILCIQVANSMLDSWNGAEMDRLGVGYGVIRRFGSLGFVLICLTASVLVGPVLPTWSCCVIMPLASVLLLLLVGTGKAEDKIPETQKEKPVSGKGLLKLVLRNYYFATYLLLNLAFCTFLAIVNLCLSYLMDYAGASQSSLGVVSGVRAAAEIVAMFWIGRSKKLPPYWTLLAAACLMVATEHLIYPWMTSFGLMVAASLLSGFGGGLYYGIGANYVLQIVDHRAVSTAMALLGVVKAAVSIVGSAVGGTVIDRYGVTALTTAAGVIMLVLTALFVAACLLGRCVWKKPYVNEKAETAG